jgi:small subunit ribosomal protein S6e
VSSEGEKMTEVRLNIGDLKSKKTYKKVLTPEQAMHFLNKKIGETISGDGIDFAGYEFKITGGSDSAGIPMRKDVNGIARKRILAVGGVGIRKTPRPGARIRKLVAGNTVYEKTSQINVAVTKWGKEPLEPVQEASEATETAE